MELAAFLIDMRQNNAVGIDNPVSAEHRFDRPRLGETAGLEHATDRLTELSAFRNSSANSLPFSRAKSEISPGG